jgi:hypothetical protein
LLQPKLDVPSVLAGGVSVIFESQQMADLRKDYAHCSDYLAPEIVRLDRLPSLAAERDYLEATLQRAKGAKQQEWLRRLLSVDEGQHLGAWFEMMLCGWLDQVGIVDIEPRVEGEPVDFAINVGARRIVVEAKALIMDSDERRYEKYAGELLSLLRGSHYPYQMHITEFAPGVEPPDQELVDAMLRLAERASSEPVGEDEDALEVGNRRYRCQQTVDRHGNAVHFYGWRDDSLPRTAASRYRGGFMDGTRVCGALSSKLGQHPAVRAAHHPYVLALFLESVRVDEDAAVEAWFGRPQVIFDQATGRILDLRWDRLGLSFAGEDVLHQDISGTLVFEARPNWDVLRRELKAYYIQNPYATTPVEGCLFPVEDRLTILHQGADGFRMGWARQSGPGYWLPPNPGGARAVG